MRGRNSDNSEIGPEILTILRESKVPMPALGINFTLNERLGKIVNLSEVESQLAHLLKTRKIEIRTRNDITYYRLNIEKKSK